jgi:hypothetical protein
MADQVGGLGAGRGGVEGGRDPLPGRVGGRVAGLAEQPHGLLDQPANRLALGPAGGPQLVGALATQGGLVGGPQPLPGLQQRAQPRPVPPGQPVHRPGRQRRAAQRLDRGRDLGVALALQPPGQLVPGGHERLGGQVEQLVARLRSGQPSHLLVRFQLAACRAAWVE